MFPINLKTDIIINAREAHLKNVICRLSQKVKGEKCGREGCSVCLVRNHQNHTLPEAFVNVFDDKVLIAEIIGAEPSDMIGVYDRFLQKLDPELTWNEYERSLLLKKGAGDLEQSELELIAIFDYWNAVFSEVFDYEEWFSNKNNQDRYDAYQLAFNLDRNTCCYCNRMYTSTVKSNYGQKVMRPVFDHWYPQHKYPLLALSFYNLIPSCTICNSSIKGKKEPDLNDQLHPYEAEDMLKRFRFSFDFYQDTTHFQIKTLIAQDDQRLKDTISKQRLELLYKAHPSELADMLSLAKAYSPDYVQQIISLFPDHSMSLREAYRLAFGTEAFADDFHRLPLSKFKYDILSELQLISYPENEPD
jgi:hypothetical protein